MWMELHELHEDTYVNRIIQKILKIIQDVF